MCVCECYLPTQNAYFKNIILDIMNSLFSCKLKFSESPAIKTNVDVNWSEIFEKAKKRALGSGGAGAVAMVVQVCSLMWMRTIMNYQV